MHLLQEKKLQNASYQKLWRKGEETEDLFSEVNFYIKYLCIRLSMGDHRKTKINTSDTLLEVLLWKIVTIWMIENKTNEIKHQIYQFTPSTLTRTCIFPWSLPPPSLW